MLGRIHSQDVALTLSQQKLESLVNAIDGIVWEFNPQNCQFTFVSRQSERVLGYPPEKWREDPKFRDSILNPEDLARAKAAREAATQRHLPYNLEYRMIAADGRTVWIRESGTLIAEDGETAACRGILQDITEQKNAAEHLNHLNRQLVDASRQAGMAEVATSVLHNVGNVLNSVNVSASLMRANLESSCVHRVIKAADLLREHADDPAAFLTSDPKGRHLPDYLIKLGDHLVTEQRVWQAELDDLGKNIEHIKEIVAMQQNYACLSGITEDLKAEDLVEDALRLNEGALDRHRVQVLRQYQKVELVRVDKHKVLQILVNLIRNAKYAMDESGKSERILTLPIFASGSGRVQIQVCDNGVGIPRDNLARIFQHGFTTRKDGHGFGLHGSVNAAREMGGNLIANSDGPGAGAVFTLELPTATGLSHPTRAKYLPA
jgi:PAS domain S-box-containing protein